MQSVEFLGITVTGVTVEELNQIIQTAVIERKKWILANHNLHSLYLFHHNDKLRKFFSRARLAHPDGMSIIALARLFGYQLSREQRVTYVDWVRPLMKKASEKEWRVLFIGGKPGVGHQASQILCKEYPGLDLKVHHGYFDRRQESKENRELLAFINSARPHILMVGMGMPLQEEWILENLEKLEVNIILPSGACMDYVAGEAPTPPRWMGRVGIEWLYRLCAEPRRLWRRYLVEPLFICRLIIKDICSKSA
jgi:N-acetylglucosaminyldiphosphoundecaprenol N-acetyl-beta-D-mannosaminyltransferase